MARLISLRITGWKSIREATIDLRALNILIGANGSGKSNLVSFFKLMNYMIAGRLQEYIGTRGGRNPCCTSAPRLRRRWGRD